MKQLPRVCYLCLLAMTAAGCSYVPGIEGRLRSLQFESDTYVARAGETLESIAFRYKLELAELKTLNPDLSTRVPAGTHVNVRRQAAIVADYQNTGSRTERNRDRAASTARPVDVVTANPIYKSEAIASVDAVAGDINPSNGSLAVKQVQPLIIDDAREEVIEISNYPREEFVEDDYEEVLRATSRNRIDKQLRKYVGNWAWPTDGQLARGYTPEKPGGHGVDIAGIPGQHVVAAMDGTVAYSGRDPSGFGKLIIVKHDDSLMTTYSHTKDLFVAEDDLVRAGDPIASMGANANQESVLRFEVRRDGNPLNPMVFFPAN